METVWPVIDEFKGTFETDSKIIVVTCHIARLLASQPADEVRNLVGLSATMHGGHGVTL